MSGPAGFNAGMARLFVALLPPATVRAELAALATPVHGVRWVPEESLHLTLRFIGDADADKQARIEDALARVRVEPFILPVGGVGLFPTRGQARVLWAGTANGHTRLYQLRKQVDEALLSVDMTLDVHSFHPHFTLGRLGHVYDPKPVAKFLEQHAKFEGPPFRVPEFHLMSSVLSPGLAPAYRTARIYSLVK